MAYAAKLLNPIRQSLTVITIPSQSLSPSRQLCTVYGRFEALKPWTKRVGPLFRTNFSRFLYKLSLQRRYIQNFGLSGSKAVGGIFGVSVVFGSICSQPHVAYTMDGQDVLLDDYRVDLLGASDPEKDSLAFWMFTLYAKKVEVQDYKLLCLARVEVGDRKLTLVGILGGWWELPSSRGVFSSLRMLLRNKVTKFS